MKEGQNCNYEKKVAYESARGHRLKKEKKKEQKKK